MILESLVIGFILLILITVIVAITYFGFFHQTVVNKGKSPIEYAGKTFAYKSFVDDYSGIGFEFTKLHNLTAIQPNEIKKKFENTTVVGLYFENPNSNDKIKFSVGLLLDHLADCFEIKEVLQKEGYKFGVFPEDSNTIFTDFENKGSFSIPMAMRSVYPEMFRFKEENQCLAYPYLEFYTREKIFFVWPLENQETYFFHHLKNDILKLDDHKKSKESDNEEISEQLAEEKKRERMDSFEELYPEDSNNDLDDIENFSKDSNSFDDSN